MREMVIRALALTGTILLLTHSAFAQGDTAAGYKLAQENCVRCHNIDRGAGFKMRPPSFQSIAIYRSADDVWARIIAPLPHSGMPETQWSLTPEEVKSLLAYITSLDTPVSLPP